MKAVTRRVYEMCVRVLAWLTAHPDDEPGMTVLVGQLQGLVARMTQLIADQRDGLIASRAASARRVELEREMLAGPIAHLARIGSLAGREVHEPRSRFAFRPAAGTHLAFQAAVRSMLAAAEEHREVLVKYGLSPSALTQFSASDAELTAAGELGTQGRRRHTAATRELRAVTKESAMLVRAIDTRIRLRFRDDRPALEAWISARTVLGTPERAVKEGDGGTAAPAPTPGPAAGGSSGSAGSGSAGSGGPTGGTPVAGGEARPAA
jgi:hypothetical protein